MTTLERAQQLAAFGLSVIALDHPSGTTQTHPSKIGKMPIGPWKAFQTASAADSQLVAWFGSGHPRNIGVVTGKISNLVIVDCDSQEAVAWADEHLPPTRWRVQTSRGEHRGYRHPGVEVANEVGVRTNDPGIKIDVRGDGGYVVAPGSTHRSGVAYEFVEAPTPTADLPVFDSTWLQLETPKRQTRQVAEIRDISDSRASKRTIGRVRAYLAKTPPAIEGEGGDTHTFTVVCKIVLGFNLTDAAAMEVLSEWNSRCSPPWSDGALRDKIINARKYGDEPIGGLLTMPNETLELAFPLTEAGDAEYFARLNQDRVRYDHRQGRWLVSDEASGIWLPDPVELLTQMTIEMMRHRQQAALELSGDDKIRGMKWALGGESRTRLANAQALARSVAPIADSGDNWDQEPFLLGTQNGVIDLRTGQFRKGTTADRITMRVRVAYDPAATCSLWLQTLEDIFASTDLLDPDRSRLMVDFMQRALGYSITGDCREECCFFVWGDGCNGKGTVMNTLGWLFGDYTDDMPYSTLEKADRGGGIPNDVAKLAGKRFVTCSEVNEFNLNETRLKALTGRDPMTARFLNREFFTFIPASKIWIATNNKPKIDGQDDGIWRRIHLIPFTQTFEGRENKRLKDQLRDELPGILNWIIEGARIWFIDGLNPPAAVRAATLDYRNEANPIKPFISAYCEKGEHFQMQAGPAFSAYERFHRDERQDGRILSDKAFSKAMRQAFKVKESRHTFYLGVRLRETPSTSGGVAFDEPTTVTKGAPERDPDDPGPEQRA